MTNVHSVMSRAVATVPPDAPVHAIASLFAERGISGAPVVDAEGRLLGMVTEGDLIRKLAATQERPRSWLWKLLGDAPRQAEHYARTRGQRARDLMTTQLVTVSEEDDLGHVARLFEDEGIRRVPVVREGKLVGIVSRADLMVALTSPPEQLAAEAPDDARIRREVASHLREQSWVDTRFVFAEVQGGVVTFHGFCRSEEVKRGLRVLAEGVEGVREVRLDLVPTPPFLLGVP
jgi:CBS domain-containing protein